MNKFKANSDGPIDAGRRSLLCGMAGIPLFQMSGCGGGASGHESVVTPLISPASQGADLPIIPMVDGSVDAAGTRNFSLVAQAGTTTFRSGVAAATLGYNGQLLGPALRLRKGENVAMHVQNNLWRGHHGPLAWSAGTCGGRRRSASGHRGRRTVDRQFHGCQRCVDLLVSPPRTRFDRSPGCHGSRGPADRR